MLKSVLLHKLKEAARSSEVVSFPPLCSINHVMCVCVCSAPCLVGWVRGHERYAVSAMWATLFLMRSAT